MATVAVVIAVWFLCSFALGGVIVLASLRRHRTRPADGRRRPAGRQGATVSPSAFR